MGRLLIAAFVVLAVAGCSQADHERTDLIDVEGVPCVVVRNGVGRIQFVDCDWSDR